LESFWVESFSWNSDGGRLLSGFVQEVLAGALQEDSSDLDFMFRARGLSKVLLMCWVQALQI
jgi:hypothetical protein